MHIEIAAGAPKNRRWGRINEVQRIRPTLRVPVWCSVYAYPDPDTSGAHFGPLHFEADAHDTQDFDRVHDEARRLVLHLMQRYDVPKDAIELKYTRRSIWIIVPPQVFGASPCSSFSVICREMARHILSELGFTGWDLSVYSRSQLTRVPGSWIPEAGRHVIHLTVDELLLGFRELYDGLAAAPRIFPHKKPVSSSLALHRLYVACAKKVRQQTTSPRGATRRLSTPRPCLTALAETGIGIGKRNALFYGMSLDAHAAGIGLQEWLAEASRITAKNQGGPMRNSEALATSRSAFNGHHRFCCAAFRARVTDRFCSGCPYNTAPDSEGTLRIGRATLRSYLQRKASTTELIRLIKLAAGSITPTEAEQRILVSTAPAARRSFIQLPTDFATVAEQLGPALRTYLVLASMARNTAGRLLLPRNLRAESIAQRTGLHIKTVKRHLATLQQLGLWKPGQTTLQTAITTPVTSATDHKNSAQTSPKPWQMLRQRQRYDSLYLRKYLSPAHPVDSCLLPCIVCVSCRSERELAGRWSVIGGRRAGSGPPVARRVGICHHGFVGEAVCFVAAGHG